MVASETTPKLWALADWQDATGLLHREEFGPYYLIDMSDGIVIPDNDLEKAILFPEENDDGWVGFDPIL